jgi:hypothetical protein
VREGLQLSPLQITPLSFVGELKDLKDNFSGNFTAFSYSPNLLLLGSHLGEVLQMELPSKVTKYFDLEGAILTLDLERAGRFVR